MNLVGPVSASSPVNNFIGLSLTMASTAVNGVYQGLIGRPVLAIELLVGVVKTLTTPIVVEYACLR